MEKWQIGIIAIVVVAALVGSFMAFGGSSLGKNTTYFVVDGAANMSQYSYESSSYFQLPIHQTVNQSLDYMLTPYVNGVAQHSLPCTMPTGIDTSKSFMLTVQFLDPKTTSVDIVANIKGSDQVVQTTRINVTNNVIKIP